MKKTVADWYQVQEIFPDLFNVFEPSDGNFFVLKSAREALFIDSGFGFKESLSGELLNALGIDKFKVVVTHAHCDHVGMNSMAEEIYISKQEWEKYQRQNEAGQIKHYYDYLEKIVKWPVLQLPPGQKAWKPTHFIDEGSTITLGKWTLESYTCPGHTVGHMFFYEPNANVIFCGDLVYDGTIYLHMKDSNLNQYFDSIKKINRFAKSKAIMPQLLPAHNTVPLSADHIDKVEKVVEKIIEKKLSPIRTEIGTALFETADRYLDNSVKILIKKGQGSHPD